MRGLPAWCLLAALLLAPLAAAQGLSLTGVESAAICFRDTDDDGIYDSNESAFLQRSGCGTTAVHDLRLSGAKFGTKIKSGDADVNLTTLAPPGLGSPPVAFVDDDSSGAFNPGDIAYLKLTGGDDVNSGDVRLTAFAGFAAGTTVAGANDDAGIPTQNLDNANVGTDWKYYDTNGNNAFDADDELYIDVDASSTITVRDIRIPPAAAAPPPPPPPPEDEEDNTTEEPPEEDANATLRAQLDTIIAQNGALAAQLNTTLASNNNLQLQLTQLGAQLTNQSEQIATLNGRITTLQAENARLQAQVQAGGNATGGQGTPGFEAAVALLVVAGAALSRRR